MTSPRILEALAPCGLNCQKCFAHIDGDIRKYANNLKEKLGKFDIYAKRFETLIGDPIFKKYPEFNTMLDYLAAEHCRGCRHEQCRLFTTCGVRACPRKKRSISATNATIFPATKRDLTNTCTPDGSNSTSASKKWASSNIMRRPRASSGIHNNQHDDYGEAETRQRQSHGIDPL